jgi:opacity protein-like surface antigen
VKRIAIVLLALGFVAYPARGDGIKGVAGTLGMGAISSILCTLTVLYDSDDEDSSSEGFDRRGFFIGAGGTFAGENFSDRPMRDIADIFSNYRPERPDIPNFDGPEATATSDDSWSVKGRGGYRCHPRYSVGATFEYFGGFDTQWTGVLGTGGDDIDMFAATVDIKGYLLTGRYQPYLLLGGGTMHIDTKVTNPTGIVTIKNPEIPAEPPRLPVIGVPVIQARDYTDFVFRFGGGFDVYATDNVVVNIGASYLLPLGEVSGVDLFTVGGGIEYRF